MKILHILTDTNISGMGRHLLAFLSAYNRDEFTVEVVLPEGSALTPLVKEMDVTVIEIPHIANRSFSLRGVFRLFRLIGELQPDIVHTHACLAGRIAGWLRRRVVINTRHYCIFEDELRPMSMRFARFANNLLCDMVIAVSPAVEDGLRQQGTKRVTTIFNGIAPLRVFSDEEKTAAREKYGLVPTDYVVAQVASMVEMKGYDSTLNAAKSLIDDEDIMFLFAGEGPHEAYLRGRVEYDELTNVVFAGFVQDVDEIMNVADVIVSAGETEAFGLPIVEAMSLGVPAVATDVGGVPFLVNDGVSGILVPPRRGDAIAEALVALRNDPIMYEEMSYASSAIYESFFTAQRMAQDMEELYLQLLEGDDEKGE